MALARASRSTLRRSEVTVNSMFNEVPTKHKFSTPSLANVTRDDNFSYLSGIRKANYASFFSRGISVVPHYQSPVAERIIDESDAECEETRYPGLEATRPSEKPRVVVLGTGWAACRFLKGLDTKIYDVVCISPRNHMVFTPLLASTCVGTLEFRSVAEPVSRIQSALASNPGSYFYLATCNGVDTDKHEVSEFSFPLSFRKKNVQCSLAREIIYWKREVKRSSVM